MKLRGVEFGSVFNAAGARNFFGDGYWFHRLPSPLRPDFRGATFVAKTTTLARRLGNMPLVSGTTKPREWFLRSIALNWRKGIAVNAVGLSGPGAAWLFAQQRWQAWPAPFFLSFMGVGETVEQRLQEASDFAHLAALHLRRFRSPVGLQVNFSCPNVGLEPTKLLVEVGETLDRFRELAVPLVPKFNVHLPHRLALHIAEHPACDAFVMGNTLPWGEVPPELRRELFGDEESPLLRRGLPAPSPGGLSGRPLLPLVVNWIREARRAGFDKPIVGCGGILSVDDAFAVLEAGAAAIELGSVAFLRPWRVQRIIRAVTRRVQQTGVPHEHPAPAGTR